MTLRVRIRKPLQMHRVGYSKRKFKILRFLEAAADEPPGYRTAIETAVLTGCNIETTRTGLRRYFSHGYVTRRPHKRTDAFEYRISAKGRRFVEGAEMFLPGARDHYQEIIDWQSTLGDLEWRFHRMKVREVKAEMAQLYTGGCR